MLTEDWQEANRVYGVEGWKSTILLCGGVLEGLLLYVLKRRKKRAGAAYRQVVPKGGQPNALDRWGLDELIKVAEHIGILGDSHLDHSRALTRYRNYVHPGKQLREQRRVSQDEATFAITTTRMAIDMLHLTATPRARRLAPGTSSSGRAVGVHSLDRHDAGKSPDRDERSADRRARIQRILEIARNRPIRYGQLLSAAKSTTRSAGPQRLLESLAGDESFETDPSLVTVDSAKFGQAAEQLVRCDKQVIGQFLAAYNGKGTAVVRKDIADEIGSYERALQAFERSVQEYIATT